MNHARLYCTISRCTYSGYVHSREGIGTIATMTTPVRRALTHVRATERPVSHENVVYDPRVNFNFHEHGARVLSLDGVLERERE